MKLDGARREPSAPDARGRFVCGEHHFDFVGVQIQDLVVHGEWDSALEQKLDSSIVQSLR
jgi:hypothetical protein